MKKLTMLVPDGPPLSVDSIEAKLVHLRQIPRQAPFAFPLLEFTDKFSQLLLQESSTRAFPEIQALGFWLRASALQKMKQNFHTKNGCLAVPQGLVFHIPPTNVDTIFAYSLFMSLLCGNTNVIRASSRRGSTTDLLLGAIRDAFQHAPENIRSSVLILSYERDQEITEVISRHADLRVVWGGNHTVQAIRSIPLAPWGRELIFPDRFSWLAMDITAYRALSETDKNQLASHVFNDVFWFDQNGCSSPRFIVWRGEQDERVTEDFYQRIAAIAKHKKWTLDTGVCILKQSRNYAAMIDYEIAKKKDFENLLTVFSLGGYNMAGAMRDTPCFGGTLFEVHIDALEELCPIIERRDQTLTYFGYTRAEIESFVSKLAGRGFDRIIPVGRALSFDEVWDGYDLPQQFTRLVRIEE